MPRYLYILLLAVTLIGVSGLRAQTRPDDDDEDGGNAPRERANWFLMQRAYPNGIPNGARSRAVRLEREMLDAAHPSNAPRTLSTTWQQVGPTNGEGRVEALAIDPTGKLYAGAAEGGVWSTPGSGEPWTPLTDTTESLAMGALAIDPQNPKTIYAGTGEWELAYGGPLTQTSPIYSGAGIMKSTDGGKTWNVIGLTNVAAFARIIVDPDNSSIVWAATTNGFYRTSDGGTTWNAILSDSLCSDLALDPNDHTRLYLAIANDGVFGVLDGQGQAPTRLNNGFPADSASLGRISLSASSSGGNTVVYALLANAAGGYTGIYKLNGVSWTTLAAPSSLIANNQGYYDLTIAASPSNANNVLVGGVYLYYSNNGGTSWTAVNNVHADNHTILFDPAVNTDVYVGCDGGVYYSSNNGQSFQFISTGMAITQYYGIDVSQATSNSLVGGTQDNGTWAGGSSLTWNQTAGGDGGETKFDPSNPSNSYSQTLAIVIGGTQSKSVNYNNTIIFTSTANEPWVFPLAVSGSSIYVGTTVVNKAVSNGSASGFNFTTISPNLTRGGTASENTIGCLAVSPNTTSIIWSGSNDGLIYITTNGGTSWANVSQGTSGRAVTRIMPISDQVAYATSSGYGPGHVLKTINQGASWTDISSNLINVAVNAITNDPQNPTHLFIGTDVGVFFSLDDGATWVPYMDGLPNVVVNELVVQNQSNTLYAGTYGRSIWQAPMDANVLALGSPIGGPVWYTNQTYPIVWYGIPTATISYSTDGGNTWIIIDDNISAPSYQWNIPGGINSSNTIVRVISGSDTLISTPFTVRPPAAGDVIGTQSVPWIPYGLAFDGYNLWSTSFTETKLYKLDPDLLTARSTVTTPSTADSCTGMAYSPTDGTFYIHELRTAGNRLFHCDSTGKNLTNSPAKSLATYPTGVAYDGTYVYAVDRDKPKIYQYDYNTLTAEGNLANPESALYGPRGLCYTGSNAAQDTETFMHVFTDFSANGASFSGSTMYRMQLINYLKFVITDSTPLTYNGGTINARGIAQDTRYPNTYWVSDYGTGNSGTIYRVVGFDLQSLNIITPAYSAVLAMGSTASITFTSQRIDTVTLSYTTDDGVTWNVIGNTVVQASSAGATTQSTYSWTVPTLSATATKCKIRAIASGGGNNPIQSTSNLFTIGNASSNSPSLTIQTPTSNQILKMGASFNISLSSQNIDSIALSFSSDGGTTWGGIGTVVVASPGTALTESAYTWTVPTLSANSTKCEIQATSLGAGSNPVQTTSGLFTIESATAVNEPAVSADGFMLYPSIPDPFQSTATIRFDAPRESEVTLKVYDVNGALVQTLFDGVANAGQHVYTFDASGMPSGMYVYRLRTGQEELSRSMLLVR